MDRSSLGYHMFRNRQSCENSSNLTDAEKFPAGERVREALGDVQLRLARLRSRRGQRRGEEFQAHAANARKEIQCLRLQLELYFLDVKSSNSKLVCDYV